MPWVVRVAPFVILVVLGVIVAAARGTRHERFANHALIAYFVAMSCTAGILQHDFWPFSAYPVIVESSSGVERAVWYEVRAVDGRGEHSVDGSPLTRSVLEKWFERRFTGLDGSEKASAALFLLRNSCRNDRVLGPLTAPDWLLYRDRSSAVQPGALRVYRNDIHRRILIYEVRRR